MSNKLTKRKPQSRFQDIDIVFRGMEDLPDLVGAQDRAEGSKLARSTQSDRIDQENVGARRDLDKTGLVEVVVEAVGLGVEGDDLF